MESSWSFVSVTLVRLRQPEREPSLKGVLLALRLSQPFRVEFRLDVRQVELVRGTAVDAVSVDLRQVAVGPAEARGDVFQQRLALRDHERIELLGDRPHVKR